MSSTDTGSILLPSPAQIALALTVVKSKPARLSIQDYLGSLRPHRSSSERAQDQIQLHIDSSTFWKQAYEKSEETQTRLLDRIYELEQQRVIGSSAPFMPDPAADVNKSKRKRDEQPQTKANSRSKRKVVSMKPAEVSLSYAEEESDQEQRVANRRITATTLLRTFLDLRQSLSQPQPDTSSILIAIRCICRAAIKAATDATAIKSDLSNESRRSPDRGLVADVKSTCTIILRSYPSILQALDILSASNETVQSSRAAAAEIVHLFQSVLGQFHAVVVLEATATCDTETPKTKHARSKSKARKPTFRLSKTARHQVCLELMKLIVNMITLLALSQQGQLGLLEGLICAFLDHLGSTLSLVVFADEDKDPRQPPLPGIMPPRGLQDANDIDVIVAIKTVRMESPYLVYLLRKIMSFLDMQDVASASNSSQFFSLTHSKDIGQGAFIRRAQEQLQNTLLRGVFGDEDETFRNALQRADGVEDVDLEDLSEAFERGEGTSEWFVSELWKHLGWEIMSGDM